MSKYDYSDGEKDINKVLKCHKGTLADIAETNEETNTSLTDTIISSEKLLSSMDKPLPKSYLSANSTSKHARSDGENNTTNKTLPLQSSNQPNIEDRSWTDITKQANDTIKGDVCLEDILSQLEIDNAISDLNKIRKEFERITALNSTDMSFLVIATALQTIRWVIMPTIGETIDKASRLKHDDKSIKAKIKNQNKIFRDTHRKVDSNNNWPVNESEKGYKTWLDIIFNSVPYDATKGAPALDVEMKGGYHRYKTLGHDPILGWIFGVVNIVTDTITLTDLSSYRIEDMKFTEPVSTPMIFLEFIESLEEDFHRLPAAIFAQGVHLASDKYTKFGLPVPILGLFSDKMADKLYRNKYDALCLGKDIKKIGASATVAILTNMIIGLVHGLFYDESVDGSRDLYEVRTRKILLWSNSLATTSNLITTALTKTPKLIDIGGLVVTVSRLFSDVRFITKMQEEFISAKIDKQLLIELAEVDRLYNCIKK